MNDDQPISDQQAATPAQTDSAEPAEPPVTAAPVAAADASSADGASSAADASPAADASSADGASSSVGANLVFARCDEPPCAEPGDAAAAPAPDPVAAAESVDQPQGQSDGQQTGDEHLVEEVAVQDVEDRPLPPCADIKPVLEALLFAVDGPVTAARLAEAIGSPQATVRQALAELQVSYNLEGRGFTLEEIAGGYQLFSRPKYAEWIERFQRKQTRTKLSAAALETLAIIAYKQPIGRADVESVRGVQAGPILRMLMEKGMIHIVGRQEVIGRPFLYGTTRKFLEHFGLKSLTDLPQAEQLQMP